MPRQLVLLILGLLLVITACDGDSDPTGPVAATSVSVRDDFFEPQDIAVAPGATVTWTWTGANPHNVTWVSGGVLNSATQTGGTYAASMPTTSGELIYYCTIHGSPTSGMRGTVTVQ